MVEKVRLMIETNAMEDVVVIITTTIIVAVVILTETTVTDGACVITETDLMTSIEVVEGVIITIEGTIIKWREIMTATMKGTMIATIIVEDTTVV